MLNVLTNSCLGLPKSSEQAYIEFESIEAIVKTASRTKFFIEFYSTCLEGERNLFLTRERVHRFLHRVYLKSYHQGLNDTESAYV